MRHHVFSAVILSLIFSATSFAQSGGFSTLSGDFAPFCDTVEGDPIAFEVGTLVAADGSTVAEGDSNQLVPNNQVVPFGTLTAVNREDIQAGNLGEENFLGAAQGSPLMFTPNPENGELNGFCLRFANRIADVRIFDGDTLIDSITTTQGQDAPDAPRTFICWENTEGVSVTHIEIENSLLSDDLALDPIAVFVVLEGKFVFEPPAPEPATCFEMLTDVRSDVDALLAASDPYGSDAYFLDGASGCLEWMQDDIFWEQPSGNRLTQYGGSLFVGAAYTILYLEQVEDPAADDIIDGLIEVLECIVDNEIAYAIENDGHACFIENAEYFAELGEIIDDDFDNEVIATLAYRLAWLNAFYATEY